jgi:hypothetical protein
LPEQYIKRPAGPEPPGRFLSKEKGKRKKEKGKRKKGKGKREKGKGKRVESRCSG